MRLSVIMTVSVSAPRAAPSGHSTLGSSSVQQLLERAETTGQYPTKSGYVQNFEVNYLGSMEVASNKGELPHHVLTSHSLHSVW